MNAPGRIGSTPQTNHQNVFTVDPEISLDTNLTSMAGIVNFDIVNSHPPPSASLSRSPSSGSTLDRVEHTASTSNGGFPEHWNGQRRMSGPMLLAGSRRGSLDPNGHLPSSSPAGSETGSLPMGIPGSSSGARKQSGGNVSSGGSNSSHPNGNSIWAAHAGIGSTTQSPISSMSITPPAGGGRPGLLRSASALSGIHTYSMAMAGQNGRRPSAVNFETSGPGSGAGSAVGSGTGRHNSTSGSGGSQPSAGAWTAPDSWAVKAEAGALDHDSSEEEVEEEEIEDLESEEALSQANGQVRAFGAGEGDVVPMGANGRPATSSGRPGTKSGRPGTADGMRSAGQKPVSPAEVSRRTVANLIARHSS